MSDLLQTLHRALSPEPGEYAVLRRNGRVLLAFPRDRETALRALRLYQPQRLKARVVVSGFKMLITCGLHWRVLPKVQIAAGPAGEKNESSGMTPDSLGVMFGNPDHKVLRAIVSGRAQGEWQVAKVAFGEGAWGVVGGEAEVLQNLPAGLPGKPEILGSYRGEDISWIRLPYVKGQVLKEGETDGVLELLDSWVLDAPAQNATTFPEWPFLEKALGSHDSGKKLLERIAELSLVSTTRHGDFARWNLLRDDAGNLVVLDWEWGMPEGMPGIDLVHYFAQDARLVRQLAPEAVVASILRSLKHPQCKAYLQRTGWAGEAHLALVATLAYTFGTGQQANGDALEAALGERF